MLYRREAAAYTTWIPSLHPTPDRLSLCGTYSLCRCLCLSKCQPEGCTSLPEEITDDSGRAAEGVRLEQSVLQVWAAAT